MKQLVSLVVIICAAFLPDLSAQCIKGDCYNGKGVYIYPSGAKYDGQFQKGKIEGKGILYFSNGNKYIGEWVNQYREGKGKMTFTNGDIYRGGFKKSKFYGKGSMEFNNGDKYVGQWIDNLQHGNGIYFYQNGDRYEGMFKAGKLNDNGTMFYTDGSKYVGQWKDNYKDGEGIYFKTDGSKLDGLWQNGRFVNEAYAETSSPSENVVETSLIDCNRMHCVSGSGIYTYADGSRWIGDFKDGLPEGHGTIYYANGDKYVGGWKQHSPHGEGIMYYNNGRAYGANWEYGRPISELDSSEDVIAMEHIEVDRDDEVKIWAVVVGVARYEHMPVLKYTDDDAYQIYAFLKSPEGGALPDDQIRVLIDEDANRNNILRAMRKVFLQADENDVVVLYFSGHGLPGSFLPVDFDGFNNKLKHEEVKQLFKETKAKHKICLADACHSGSLMAMRSPFEHPLKKYYDAFEKSDGGTALLLSSKGDEFSLEDQGLRQGIFSHYLIRGLKGEADADSDQIVTIQELFDFVYTKVRTYTGNVQTPTLTGTFDEAMPVAVIR